MTSPFCRVLKGRCLQLKPVSCQPQCVCDPGTVLPGMPATDLETVRWFETFDLNFERNVV
jgi:hypothetical protein